jgi:hypothetical protein
MSSDPKCITDQFHRAPEDHQNVKGSSLFPLDGVGDVEDETDGKDHDSCDPQPKRGCISENGKTPTDDQDIKYCSCHDDLKTFLSDLSKSPDYFSRGTAATDIVHTCICL